MFVIICGAHVSNYVKYLCVVAAVIKRRRPSQSDDRAEKSKFLVSLRQRFLSISVPVVRIRATRKLVENSRCNSPLSGELVLLTGDLCRFLPIVLSMTDRKLLLRALGY